MIVTSETRPSEYKNNTTNPYGIVPYQKKMILDATDLPKSATIHPKYTRTEASPTTQEELSFSQALGKYSLKSGSDSSFGEVRSSFHQNLREPIARESIKESNREFALKNLANNRDTLSKKRYQLFKKKITTGITNRESAELRYIEWQLERIEDAYMSPVLAQLKNKTDERKALSREIKKFVQSVNATSTNRKRSK